MVSLNSISHSRLRAPNVYTVLSPFFSLGNEPTFALYQLHKEGEGYAEKCVKHLKLRSKKCRNLWGRKFILPYTVGVATCGNSCDIAQMKTAFLVDIRIRAQRQRVALEQWHLGRDKTRTLARQGTEVIYRPAILALTFGA